MASFQVADGLATAIYNKIKTTICNLIYPVGSIKMTVVNTNPSTYLGGTWSLWGSGRVPVGVNTSDSNFNTVEKTGGSKYLQAHSHQFRAVKERQNQITGGEHASDLPVASRTDGDNIGWSNYASGTAVGGVTDVTTGSSNNLQPYITCYMWKRTA